MSGPCLPTDCHFHCHHPQLAAANRVTTETLNPNLKGSETSIFSKLEEGPTGGGEGGGPYRVLRPHRTQHP
jgi:hypothetical protein